MNCRVQGPHDTSVGLNMCPVAGWYGLSHVQHFTGAPWGCVRGACSEGRRSSPRRSDRLERERLAGGALGAVLLELGALELDALEQPRAAALGALGAVLGALGVLLGAVCGVGGAPRIV